RPLAPRAIRGPGRRRDPRGPRLRFLGPPRGLSGRCAGHAGRPRRHLAPPPGDPARDRAARPRRPPVPGKYGPPHRGPPGRTRPPSVRLLLGHAESVSGRILEQPLFNIVSFSRPGEEDRKQRLQAKTPLKPAAGADGPATERFDNPPEIQEPFSIRLKRARI